MEVLSQLRMPRLKRSCCGCSLELGTKIIAFVHLIIYGGLFSVIFVFMCIDDYNWHKKGAYSYEDFENAFFRDEFTMALVVSTVMYSVVLYMGVRKRDSILVVPWLVLKFFMFYTSFLFIFEAIYQRVSYGFKSKETIIQLVYTGLDAYQICVVYSFFKELKTVGSEYE